MERQRSFLSIKEAAKRTSLSSRFLYEACAKKQIRHFKVGSRIVIDSVDLDNFIHAGEVAVVEDWSKELGIE